MTLYWLGTLAVVVMAITIAAYVEYLRDCRRPPSKYPPGYGYPSLEDWQRKTMENYRAPLWKRLRRWWRG